MESMQQKNIIGIPKTASFEGETPGIGIYTQKILNKIPNIEENWNPCIKKFDIESNIMKKKEKHQENRIFYK